MKEGVTCDYCHLNPGGGGPRNFRGLYYKAHGHSFADFDETYESKAAGVAAGSRAADAKAVNPDYPNVKVPDALNFTVKDIDGKPVNLARYQGNVILIINVASKCGNTPQYAGLEKLYEKDKGKGFVILGFPANEFGHQEPGTNKEIKEFCTSTYAVKFPMFSKIVVKGEGQHPLYKFLTDKETDPDFAGDIDWNFAKFLVDRNGKVVARFKAGTKPDDPEFAAEVDKLIAQPKPDQPAPSAQK
jgi:glutathione peroxidase